MECGIPKGNIPVGNVRRIDIGDGDYRTLRRIPANLAGKMLQFKSTKLIQVKGVRADGEKMEMKGVKDDRLDTGIFLEEMSERYLEMPLVPPILIEMAKRKKVFSFTEIELLADHGLMPSY